MIFHYAGKYNGDESSLPYKEHLSLIHISENTGGARVEIFFLSSQETS